MHYIPLPSTSTCVSVVVCGVRQLRPCLSYSRRRDCINSGLFRGFGKGGRGTTSERLLPWPLHQVDHHNEARRPYLAPNDTAPRVALISSPKDLTGKTGVDVDNQVRAYWVWAKLHALGLRPLVASHDGEALRLAAKYDLPTDTKFEMHSEFHEPTYAGLFQRAFERSGADMVLLSNSDVLYTTDLLETIRFVHREAARFQVCSGAVRLQIWGWDRGPLEGGLVDRGKTE